METTGLNDIKTKIMRKETTKERAKRRKKIHVTNMKVRDVFTEQKTKPTKRKSKRVTSASSTKTGKGSVLQTMITKIRRVMPRT